MSSVAELKAEINRIKAKLSASSDHDIKEALQFRLEALEAQVTSALKEEEKEAEAQVVATQLPSEKLSPVEFEKQLRAARAHFIAGRKQECVQLLEALELAEPNNADVMELRADLAIARKDYTSALKVLKKARAIDKNNKQLEIKLAEVSIMATSLGSLDDQLRAAESGIPIVGSGDITATATAATLFSLFIPGSGHLTLGKTVKGLVYLISWSLLIIYLMADQTIFKGIVGLVSGKSTDINAGPLFAAFIALGIHLVAITECAAIAKRVTPRAKLDKPKPPVDLPFE